MKRLLFTTFLFLLTQASLNAQERIVDIDTNSAFMEKIDGVWRIRTSLRTEEIKDAEKAAIEAINQFQDAITYLWMPRSVDEPWTQYKTRKLDRIDKALKLFIGEGKIYFRNIGEAKYRVYWGTEMNSYYYTDFLGKIRKINKSETVLVDNQRYYISSGQVKLPAVQIEITSKNRSSRLYTVENYLKNIAQIKEGTYIKYDKVDIQCGGFSVSKGLKRGEDGCFHGTIKYWQKFSGYRGEAMRYSDITYREVEIIVCLEMQGNELVMAVKLGDIRALSTE